jgi:MscS family membrane protein
LARQLKTLLDLGDIDIGSISQAPEGNLEEQRRVSRETIGTVKTPNGDLDVLLDRVELLNQAPIWRFSQETLTRVPSAYASVRHRDIASYFPEWSASIKFLSVPLWRWALIFVAVGITLLVATLLTHLLVWLLQHLSRGKFTGPVEHAVTKLRAPIFGLMLAGVLDFATDYALTALGRHFWSRTAILIAIVSGAWLIVRLSDIVASFLCHRLTQQMQVERVTFVGLLARLFKILIAIILFIVLLTEAGVNVSALIAGLGIGGIALALAAQKTLADLFGGIAVVMRGAVRVGDFCTVAGRQGTVEEIGISSMRLRTQDRSVISIPNSKVAEMDLENFALRDQFWIHQVFTLRFDTTYTVMHQVLSEIVEVLHRRPDIDPESARARLIQLMPSGPQIEVYAYYRKLGADFSAFLEEQEKIILEIMRIVEEAGTTMAAPMGLFKMESPQNKTAAQTSAPTGKPVDSAGADR